MGFTWDLWDETNKTSPLKMGCLEDDFTASYWGISAYFQGPCLLLVSGARYLLMVC